MKYSKRLIKVIIQNSIFDKDLCQKLSIKYFILKKEEKKMKYQKPEVTRIEVKIKTNTNASDRSSCEGGHCVKATYSQDPWC